MSGLSTVPVLKILAETESEKDLIEKLCFKVKSDT